MHPLKVISVKIQILKSQELRNMNKTLIMLRGVPGCGKTTFGKLLGGIQVEADQYFTIDGEYKFDITQLSKAHQYCKSQVEAWMSTNSSQINTDKIVISNTSTNEWELEPYYKLAEKYGYAVFSVVVENRHGNAEETNQHGVPKEILDKMEKNLKNSIKLK